MRFAIVALLVAASTVSAASLQARQDSYPSCALPCVLNPTNLFGCSADDNACLCKSSDYVAETTDCIAKACTADDAAKADSLAQGLCKAVGVTLTSTPAPAPTASSSDSATESVPASATSVPASSGSSAPSPASSGAQSGASAASSGSASGSGSGSA
ncbi:hypothetical protein BC629DRAFT_55286 [Irpex lacteus]|nr:hypothetical protein BC629DRAFT_55286 [Irpex lacteus]